MITFLVVSILFMNVVLSQIMKCVIPEGVVINMDFGGRVLITAVNAFKWVAIVTALYFDYRIILFILRSLGFEG